jgi:hypothetical protein
MKVTLEFDMGDVVIGMDEHRKLDLCLRAEAMHGLLLELDERLRTREKHVLLSIATLDEIGELRTWLFNEIQDRTIPWE